MDNAELTALQTVRDEYRKIKDKYLKKAAKERAKVNDVYVMYGLWGKMLYRFRDK